MKRLAALLAVLAVEPVAAQDLAYDPGLTEHCLAGAEMREEREACIGLASDACVNDTPGGSSTVGISGCLSKETDWWDARLNTVYGQAMTKAKRSDAQAKELGSSAPSQAKALRGMQRAWIGFRDGKCSYEATLWQGGTGAGPAYVGCLMWITADQALFLETAADY